MTRHSLIAEGAPHDDTGERIWVYWTGGVSGQGRAKCACGELSDVLASGNARKAWHRGHKADLKSASSGQS